ncbi:MAG: methyltransferase domain-containing protein [Acidobacteriota bacterium]
MLSITMPHPPSSNADASLPAIVDRVLHACGAGRVLCLAADPSTATAAFRSRAVDAHGEPFRLRGGRLPFPDAAFDIVYADAILEGIEQTAIECAVREILRVAGRAVAVRTRTQSRLDCERAWLAFACRKHPLHQVLAPYQELDWVDPGSTLLFEPLPRDLPIGREVADLVGARDLHMDMLREPGRRADAHVARYMFARQFIRSGDRVVDAACGLGYGAAILADSTFAESVLGVDIDPTATAYGRWHYGRQRSRLSFRTLDITNIGSLPQGSVDAVVSFETLEHVADPDGFLAACRHVLTPAGRFIGSVPNAWLDAHGRDPNPHHVTVFDRHALEAMCRKYFFIEHTFGQTAGGGMKLPDAGRTLWPAEPDDRTEAEWWLIVGMSGLFHADGPVRHALLDGPADAPTNLLAFDRDYDVPWLVRAMVVIGLRTESHALLADLARDTLTHGRADSADAGAALCVQAYRYLERGDPPPSDLLARIADYVARPASVPHARRWQISLRYAAALLALQRGDLDAATVSLEACAEADPLVFSPHLGTKTVGAAFLRGWIALQARDVENARRWWTRGVDSAERVLHCPWQEFMLSRRSPALFGLREAAVIVDLASQCATGLALADQAAERPGLVASQLFESLQERIRRASLPGPTMVTAPAAAPPFRWSMLEHFDEITLRAGERHQIDKWSATIGDVFADALLLHPPAVAEFTIPSGEAGRIRTALGIHPDVWGLPRATACTFTLTVDHVWTATGVIDPHTNPADRRWIELILDVPTSRTNTHVVTLCTNAERTNHGWALFRGPIFEAAG